MFKTHDISFFKKKKKKLLEELSLKAKVTELSDVKQKTQSVSEKFLLLPVRIHPGSSLCACTRKG